MEMMRLPFEDQMRFTNAIVNLLTVVEENLDFTAPAVLERSAQQPPAGQNCGSAGKDGNRQMGTGR